MTAADFSAWLHHMKWSQRRASRELGHAQNTIGAWIKGKAEIPPSIAYACSAIAFGLPKWKQP